MTRLSPKSTLKPEAGPHAAPSRAVHSKTKQLEQLRDDILRRIPHAWLFPEHGAVKGFLGAGPLMLVAERPSTSGETYPRYLYALLEKYGAGDAHLTDLIKSRGKITDAYPENLAPHRHVFVRELEIVDPTTIVAFGANVYKLLLFFLSDRPRISIRAVWHYAYGPRWGRTREFQTQLRKALKV